MRDGRQSGNPWRTVSKPYALHPLKSRIHASVHDMNSLMGNNQAMSTPNKKRSLRVFFLSTLLLSASLCEQLLAGGSGENTGLFFFGYFVWIFEYMPYFPSLNLSILTKICALVWIYVLLPVTQTTMWLRSFPMSLNICRITFCANSRHRRTSRR